MSQVQLKAEAVVRAERDRFVNLQVDKSGNGAAGKDVVKRVARGEGRSGAADDLTPRHNRDVGSRKLLKVHIPIACRNPVWEPLQEREQSSQNGGIGLSLQPCSGLQVNSDQSEPPLHSGQLNCDKAAAIHCEGLDQPRMRLPGRGDHKPSFGGVGGGGTCPEGVEAHFH